MNDTINLEAMFLTPTVAMKEAKRCESLAATFAKHADDPCYHNPAAAAQIRDEYRERAARLRQIAKPTSPRISA